MRKRSVFLHAVSAMMRDMMKKDKWAEKYNPYQLFKVNQYDYNTLGEYLDALREKWKDEADPYGECDDYVDVSHYRDFNSYESEVDMYLERGRWRRNDYDYGRYNVNPMDYETEEDYLKALSLKVREDYDPLDDFPAPSFFDCIIIVKKRIK